MVIFMLLNYIFDNVVFNILFLVVCIEIEKNI